jgi:hypothetical protein
MFPENRREQFLCLPVRLAPPISQFDDLDFDFAYIGTAMEHVYQVLEGLTVYLIETHGQNEEWQEILNSY